MAQAKARTPRLGKGLSTLMARPVQVILPGSAPPTAPVDPNATPQQSDAATTPPAAPPPTAPASPPATTPHARYIPGTTAGPGLVHIPIDSIRPNPFQPRQKFDADSLKRLAQSIKTDGMMQPVIVRPAPTSGGAPGTPVAPATPSDGHHAAYELVAGERRWRAAQLAGLTHVPAIVRTLSDRQIAEWSLIENLQREDLNPIERAKAFERLIDHYHLTHDQIAQRIGVERSSISNTLRLLSLHADVQQLVRENLLSLGQAKAIAAVSDPAQQRALAQRTIRGDWSVRQLEMAVRQILAAAGQAQGDAQDKPRVRSAYLADLEVQVGQQLNTKVHISSGRKKGTGTLSIDFYSLDQFDALLGRMGIKTE